MNAAHRIPISAILIALLLPITTAHAQLGELIRQGEHADISGGQTDLGNIGNALSGQSLATASSENVAGLIEFCINKNYFKENDALPIKDALISKLSGDGAFPGKDYKNGAKGLLVSGDRQQLDLNSLKAEANKKICEKALAKGSSLL
jgi:hypothetical protein